MQGVKIQLNKKATTENVARQHLKAPHNQKFINPNPQQKKKGKKYPKSISQQSK